MFASLLYHGFGVTGYKYIRTRYQKGLVYFTLNHADFSLRCPVCNSYAVKRRGKTPRLYRTLPIGRKTDGLKWMFSALNALNARAFDR